MVRAVDKADAMLTLSSAVLYRKPFTILVGEMHHFEIFAIIRVKIWPFKRLFGLKLSETSF